MTDLHNLLSADLFNRFAWRLLVVGFVGGLVWGLIIGFVVWGVLT